MSGTSLDGIDISLVKTNGIDLIRLDKNFYHRYDHKTRNYLLNTLQEDININLEKQEYIGKIITNEHIKALKNLNIVQKCDLIGFHGQTIYHNPNTQTSIQLGNPKNLANTFQKKIIFNFRSKDIEFGGQGAPLAPIYHKYIIENLKLNKPSCMLNIGGVANLTFWDGNTLIGFDTGPGNALMDNYSRLISNNYFDINGEIASQGLANKKIIEKFMKNDFFQMAPPKSLDRNTFSYFYEELLKINLSKFDTMATLAEFTIESIVLAFNFLPKKVKSILVTGGGYRNKYVMKNLKKRLDMEFILEPDLLFSLDYVESELIAYLSARSLYKLPFTFPSTTGTSVSTTGGKLYNYL